MIRIKNLTKVFVNSDGQKTAVDSLSFSVGPGEVFGLLGPNGAGKTTTLRMILGLLEPTSGMAEIKGFDVSTQPNEVKRRIGFASASVGVYPWLSPQEMLSFVADLYDVAPAIASVRIGELAKLLDIEPIMTQRCATLSTGQKQRINLARALVHDPPVMLMDEPTRGLDVVGSKVIFDYIDLLRSRNKAVIVCTHRLDEAERLCDRFGLLHHGVMRQFGTIEELRAETGRYHLTDMFLDLLKSEPDSAGQGSLANRNTQPVSFEGVPAKTPAPGEDEI